jgi:hypothetical protein
LLIVTADNRRIIDGRAFPDFVDRPTDELDVLVAIAVAFAALHTNRLAAVRDGLAVLLGIRNVGLLIESVNDGTDFNRVCGMVTYS